MQTWEYAPQYALRTYAYLYPMVGIGKLWQMIVRYLPWKWKDALSSALLLLLLTADMSSSLSTDDASLSTNRLTMTATMNHGRMENMVHDDKPLIFALLRSTLALLACISELYFLDAIYSLSSTPSTETNNNMIMDNVYSDSGKHNIHKRNTNHPPPPPRRTLPEPQTMITAHLTAFIGLFASGNFHAMGSYLPSATVMSLWKMSASNIMMWNHEGRAILWAIVAVLATGWPFCAALFVPIGIHAVWNTASHRSRTSNNNGAVVVVEVVLGETETKSNLVVENKINFNFGAIIHLVIWSCLHAVLIGFGVALVDYYSYGFWAFPTWNIFVYNSQGGGDELYGVEPFSYYVKNLALNFNVVSLLGVMALPVIWVLKFVKGRRDGDTLWVETLLLLPMYIWMVLIFPRPHKEERFLYPIYPMLSYGAAITVREGLSLLTALSPTFDRWSRSGWSSRKLFIGVVALCAPAAVSTLRSLALHRYYSAPVEVYRELFYHASAVTPSSSVTPATSYVCTAGEWYRFPSSFFLPANHKLGYLKSSFEGQLPQPFTVHGSRFESLAMLEAGRFNDRNVEEMDRYIDISMCSYVIELVPMNFRSDDAHDIPEGVRYMDSDKSGGSWEVLASRQFLDAEKTPMLHRILYIPSFGSMVHDDVVAYKRYNVYERRG